MPALNFAAHARTGPNPDTTTHQHGGGATSYICHMAAMHWAFMDLGDTQLIAQQRVEAIIRAMCRGCRDANVPMHGSIPPRWYGQHFCSGRATSIMGRGVLYATVDVGDVLILPNQMSPMHTMVVVQKSTTLGRSYVYVRGFNNFLTLGTGAHNRYDNADRDIDKASYWHNSATGEVFGLAAATGGRLLKLPYATYSANAAVVRNNTALHMGAMRYTGPT